MKDDIIFAEDDTEEEQTTEKWKILIVDDEDAVHSLTILNLQGFSFEGKGLEFISAYSGEKANHLIKENPDTALVLLDVVMEDTDSGLRVIKYIRETLRNDVVRIVLRTGQPGHAPRTEVIVNYDINDYKEKQELTYQELFTTVISSLRAYQGILNLKNTNKELQEINEQLETEIGERRRAEENLRESEKKFRSISSSAQDAIMLMDNWGKISYWNEAAEKMFGYSNQEIMGRELHSLLAPPKYLEDFGSGFSKFQTTGQGRVIGNTVELSALRKNGEEFPIEISVSAFLAKKQWQATGIIRDITERKINEEKIRRKNAAFEKFVPKEFLRRLNKEEIEDIIFGESFEDEMSVLFADIRSFTTISENLTHEETFHFLNRYLESVIPAILMHGGFIDKFMGDGVMALFGGSNTGVADDAVYGAIAMQEAIKNYNIYRKNSGYPSIVIGIGVHTGRLTLGTVGFKDRMETTVISDTVNVASRVEGLTKKFGVSVAITSSTYSRLKYPQSFLFREIDTVKVKGRDKKVTIYDIFNSDPGEIKEKKINTLGRYNEAIHLFKERNWREALRLFTEVEQQLKTDKVVKNYLEECHAAIEK